jgi:hypothetical protein
MTNTASIKERYLKDSVRIRLGGIAANLARVHSFSKNPLHKEAVENLLDESKYFIEWTANEAESDMKELLINLQITIALWQLNYNDIWSNDLRKKELARDSKEYSNQILVLSGLIK